MSDLNEERNPRLAPADVSSTLATILQRDADNPETRPFLAILGKATDWDGLAGAVRLTQARWLSNALNLTFDNGQTFTLAVAAGRITQD